MDQRTLTFNRNVNVATTLDTCTGCQFFIAMLFVLNFKQYLMRKILNFNHETMIPSTINQIIQRVTNDEKHVQAGIR